MIIERVGVLIQTAKKAKIVEYCKRTLLTLGCETMPYDLSRYSGVILKLDTRGRRRCERREVNDYRRGLSLLPTQTAEYECCTR